MRAVPAALLAVCLGCSVVVFLEGPARAAERAIDYGDMRCAFAIKQHAHLDSQIVTWARGYLDGYAGAMTKTDYTASIGGSEPATVLSDSTILRNQLRAYCLRHRSQPLEGALRQILDRIGVSVGEAPTH
ncbi:hypothetical protein ACMDCR_21655 [Labrys okinawensis]|uniref:hypothetical protein n=1 Tax=Labrys okinawensis TaxID=346911 RepID=UPI0039BD1B56